MKPKIKRVKTGSYQGLWRCDGYGAMGLGLSPKVAYWNWEQNVKSPKVAYCR